MNKANAVLIGLITLTAGCASNYQNNNQPVGNVDQRLVGSWQIYSEAIFYDTGNGDYLNTPSTERLNLDASGSWTFGTSSGNWGVTDITPADWIKWKVSSYGPTKKIVLNGWSNAGSADGPIEDSSTPNRVDFIWVIYHADPPTVTRAGLVQIKFGHASGG